MHASSKCRSDQTLQYAVYTFQGKSNCRIVFQPYLNLLTLFPLYQQQIVLMIPELYSENLHYLHTIYATANSVVNKVVQTTQLTLKQKILLRQLGTIYTFCMQRDSLFGPTWPYSSEPESPPLPIHSSGIKIETDYCNVMQFVS